jgi:predicted HTH domain antitoxin
MTTLSFDLPDEAIRSVAATPEEFLCELRLAAAVFWYGRSAVSQGTAAAIAGLDRTDFLLALSRHQHDIFPVDLDDLDRELARTRPAHRQEQQAGG